MYYAPVYMMFFLLFCMLQYFFILLHLLTKDRYTILGYSLFAFSIGSVILIMVYTYSTGIFLDENPRSSSFGIGFFELIILSYAYINLILAYLIGRKK